jgi:hypothetical protein
MTDYTGEGIFKTGKLKRKNSGENAFAVKQVKSGGCRR